MNRLLILSAGLATLGLAENLVPAAIVSSPGERVWTPTIDQDMYDVSPDGRLISFVDWSTGNLMVHELSTGSNRDLTRKGSYAQSDDEAESGTFSPDGKSLAYEWWDSKNRQDELRTIGVDGNNVRTIYRKAGVTVWPLAFTRDGSILTILDNAAGRDIAIVAPNGAAPRVLKTVPKNNRSLAAVLSPDEHYLAYTVQTSNDRKRDIVVINVADGRETGQIVNAADDAPVRWTRSNALLFTSDRDRSYGIWSQTMNAGRPSDAPSLVRGDMWRLSNVFFAADGRMFYGIQAGDRDVYSVAVDPVTGKAGGQRISISTKPGEEYTAAQFSPDGKYVTYMRREREGLRYSKLVIRSLSSDEVREFLPRVDGPERPRWIPGARAIALQGRDTLNRPGIYRFDLVQGKATLLVPNTNSPVAFSPDGRTLYYSPFLPGDTTVRRIVARDVVSGRERTLYTAPRGRYVPAHSVSKDGKTLIAMWSEFANGQQKGPGPRGVLAISTETGAARLISASIPYDTLRQQARALGFTADQKNFVIMIQSGSNPANLTLWRVPLAGGPAVTLGAAPDGVEINALQSAGSWFNSDATRMVFVAGGIRRELWRVDDGALRGE